LVLPKSMPMDAICMAMILLDMNCRVVIYSAADHLINPCRGDLECNGDISPTNRSGNSNSGKFVK
jgi:hypothetical protein